MPYIITTYQPDGFPDHAMPDLLPANRTAVATLEEARDHVTDMFPFPQFSHRVTERVGNDLSAMPESGGTVGPLPDGTVIEVRQVSFQALNREIGAQGSRLWDEQDKRDILTAFNARA